MRTTRMSKATLAVAVAIAATASLALINPWQASGGTDRREAQSPRSTERSSHHQNLTQRNKAIVRRFNELAFRDGKDAEALELVGETYTNFEAGGVTTNRATLEGFLAAIPGDPSFALDDVFGEKDRVTVRYEAVINGTPTIGLDVYRVRNGKIVEHWDSFALPSSQPPAP